MVSKANDIVKVEILNEEQLGGLIYMIRGQQVMLDSDLAAIYGYSTKAFNQQVKNNIEKFDEEDFMFQLTLDEAKSISRSKISTLNLGEFSRSKKLTMDENARGKNIKYAPYAFTESGIYMLMTVLKGDIATRQSKALIRTFRRMKDYIVENQGVLGQREYLQLSMQTSENVRDIMEMRQSLTELDNKVAHIVNQLGEVVTQSELSNIMLDFSKPAVRYGWLILNGQPVESDLAYQQIYSEAKESIIMIDDYINLKSLSLMKSAAEDIKVTVVSDNVKKYLKQFEADDIRRQYPKRSFEYKVANGIFHDRYIVLDYKTSNEKIYHCGASSKDGGNKVTTISLLTESNIYHQLIDQALHNDALVLPTT